MTILSKPTKALLLIAEMWLITNKQDSFHTVDTGIKSNLKWQPSLPNWTPLKIELELLIRLNTQIQEIFKVVLLPASALIFLGV